MTRYAVKTKERSNVAARGACQHHWIIETPNGPEIPGKCRRCGEERNFPAVPEPVAWVASLATFDGTFGAAALRDGDDA